MPRTLEEIKLQLRTAASNGDTEALVLLANELQELGTPMALATEHSTRAMVARMLGENHDAIPEYKAAIELYETLGDLNGAAHACNNLGIVYRDLGNTVEALEYYHRSLAIYEDLGQREGLAYVINNIGIIHHTSGNYPQALEHYHRALEIQEELGDTPGVALVLGNIGVVHRATGSFDQALEYYRRSQTLYTDLHDRSGVASVTGNIGNLLTEKGEFDQALEHLHQALEIHRSLADEARIARVTGNIGTTLLQAGRTDEARAVISEFLEMDVTDPGVRIDQLSLCARLQVVDDELEGAMATYQRALEIAHAQGLRSHEATTHLSLREIAQKNNDLARYIEHNDAYTKISEEIRGKEATLNVALQEKQREIKAMERDRERERTVLYSTLPKHVADRMVRGEQVTDHYDEATVLFLDIVGFTTISDLIPPGHVILLLKAIFEVCDRACSSYGLTKVKTIGDSYLAICTPDTVDIESGQHHSVAAASAAKNMITELKALEVFIDPSFGDTSWTTEIGEIAVRVGLHCGPLVAGIVGTERLQYDVWGDTVNTASRMESTSEPGRIQVSEAFATALSSFGTHTLEDRGEIEVKGKGTMHTYWLT